MSRRKTHAEFVAKMADRLITVIGEYETSKTKIAVRCEACGCEWRGRPDHLLQGHGCPTCAHRAVGLMSRKENAILENNEDWLLIDISTKTHQNATMAVDRDVWERFRSEVGTHVSACMYWSAKYIYATYNCGGKLFNFHRFVLKGSLRKGLEVDHKRHGSMTFVDNRRSNLRVASRMENLRNQGRRSDNTSGVPGVGFEKRRNRWVSYITVNGKRLHLGYFLPGDLFNAVAVRKSAELRYFKDFAYAANNA